MNIKTKPAEDVGILVGRFQVHELHEAHRDLIDTVRAKHDRVIIFVGLSPLRNTPSNPLDFNTRKRMILETFPDVEVYYVEDNASDEVWSRNLDRQIEKWLKPYQTAVLYGSRDSFIPHYRGKYKTQELESTKYISGTEIRRRIANSFTPTVEFRAGVISASLDRYVTCYPTVDIAILDRSKFRVLMGQKDGELYFRFIGGFSSPNSPSYEADARREVMEETGVAVDNLQYIGSTIISDWRYRKEQDKIKTLFFVADYQFGRPQADDDIAYVEWVSMADFMNDTVKVMPEHRPLVDMLVNYISRNILLPDTK
jgi:bifunctional NMN adenylyltransferase/nudix hydrolase